MVYGLCDYRPVKEAWKLLRIDWISSYCVYATNSALRNERFSAAIWALQFAESEIT